jgi:hypothetical protein
MDTFVDLARSCKLGKILSCSSGIFLSATIQIGVRSYADLLTHDPVAAAAARHRQSKWFIVV